MHIFSIDRDYIETFGLELVQGRNFSKEIAMDIGRVYIVNETAVSRLGWETPVGKLITISGQRAGHRYRCAQSARRPLRFL